MRSAAAGDDPRRPPRAPQSRLLSAGVIAWALLQGGLALAVVALVYFEAASSGMNAAEVRTMTFVTLVLVNFTLVLVNRSFDRHWAVSLAHVNVALACVAVVAAGLMAIAIAWTPARTLFGFGELHVHDLGYVTLGAAAMIAVLELAKRFWRRHLVA